MIERIPFATLGRFDTDWLVARYHFSFAGYRDPNRVGVGPLLVWNDDTVRPGSGFDRHPHRDMEIITYVRSGAITHEDHLGNRGRTKAGDVQVMTAGAGILHAEYNLEDEPTQIFQIWIEPFQRGLAPGWAQRRFPKSDRAGELVVLASGRDRDRAGANGSALPIHQDAALLGTTLRRGQSVDLDLAKGRRAYLVAAYGCYDVNHVEADARDGVLVRDVPCARLTAHEDSEIVIADLP